MMSMPYLNFQRNYVRSLLIFVLSFTLLNNICLAETIIIDGKTIINQPTTYKNVTLDLSHGYFFITGNATLKIENSEIKGIISPNNPYLLNVSYGDIISINNVFNVQVKDIKSSPTESPFYRAIHIRQGKLSMIGNYFTVDKP